MKRPLWLVPVIIAPLILTDSNAFASRPAPCTTVTPPPPPVTPTTVDTIGQAYFCVLDHYAKAVDDRDMLMAAFAGLAQELERLGRDQADATVPALTGNVDDDWAAFRSVYQRVTDRLPADARQAVAAGAMKAMVSALHDNHANWSHAIQPPKPYGLGFEFTPAPPVFLNAPAEALPPVYVTDVLGGPAAAAGLRPGDVIEAVDGAPLFVDGVPSIGALRLLDQEYPRGDRIRVTVRRPATGREWTVPMKPELFDPAPRPLVTAKKLGDIASVRLSGFAPQAADQVFAAIKNLGPVRGLVLDLRGNGGGSPVEVARLLGGFVHGKVISSWCDKSNTCTPNHTDDTVPLLNLPLVVLTSHDCASACEAFSSGVKDLKLGTLVGTRTAGLVSGPAGVYVLSDNSLIRMPSQHEKAANGEVVNGVGVAPDIFLPRTADDVSAGRDPALDKALLLLAH